MPLPVTIQAIIEAMDAPGEWESFLDPETGELVTVTEEERSILDRYEYESSLPDDLPDWLQQSVASVRRVLDSGRALRLPDKYDIHEWDMMRRFSASLEDPDQRTELLDAIHGTGAFRIFRRTTDRLGLRERWFGYRNEAFRQIARDWLEEHGVPWVDEDGAGASPGSAPDRPRQA